MSFRVGDKVVCVDDKPCAIQARAGLRRSGEVPVQGRVYVIRAVWRSPESLPGVNPSGILLQFVGFPDQISIRGNLCGFTAWRFRKLDDIKQENAERVRKPRKKPQLQEATQ